MEGKIFYGIVCERDCDPETAAKYGHKPQGPILMETYLNEETESLAVAEARRKVFDGGRYGKAWIAKITII